MSDQGTPQDRSQRKKRPYGPRAAGGTRGDEWAEDYEIEPEPDPEYGDFWPEVDEADGVY
jgi:hypothetical protein